MTDASDAEAVDADGVSAGDQSKGVDSPAPDAVDDVPVADVDRSAEGERDTYLEDLRRLQADFENYRKRMLKQQDEARDRANESFVQKLLPVLDTIELALAHDPHASLEQVRTSLVEVLTKEGVERIESVGALFDPTLHEAVAHESGVGDPVVAEELRAGYRLKGRVIRPAMVKVTG